MPPSTPLVDATRFHHDAPHARQSFAALALFVNIFHLQHKGSDEGPRETPQDRFALLFDEPMHRIPLATLAGDAR